MSNETQKLIGKPWAVYSYDAWGAWGFAKVVKEDKDEGKIYNLWLRLYEGEQRFSIDDQPEDEAWDPRYVKTFDNLLKMMAYFLVHQRKFNPPYDKNSVIKSFLFRFPNERNNIEKLLAQSKPKCTIVDDSSIGASLLRPSEN